MTRIIDLNKIAEDYQKSRERLILLDYDGILVHFELHNELTNPNSYVRQVLNRLASDPKNTGILISGRDKEYLESHCGSLPMALVAEHGGFYRNRGEDWSQVFSLPVDWICKTLPALNALSFEYEGSFVEQKSFSITWDYSAVKETVTDDDKRQILAAIRSLPERSHFEIYDGEYTLELRTAGIDKGAFISLWMVNKYYDFIMAIGDGQTDEDLFKVLGKEAYSIKVGMTNNSYANFFLSDQRNVLPFLQSVLYF